MSDTVPVEALRQILLRIDGKGYKAYREIARYLSDSPASRLPSIQCNRTLSQHPAACGRWSRLQLPSCLIGCMPMQAGLLASVATSPGPLPARQTSCPRGGAAGKVAKSASSRPDSRCWRTRRCRYMATALSRRDLQSACRPRAEEFWAGRLAVCSWRNCPGSSPTACTPEATPRTICGSTPP